MNAADQYLAAQAGLASLLPPPAAPGSGTQLIKVPFDLSNSIALPGPATLNSIVLAYPVPPGWDGRITSLIFQVSAGGFVQGSGALVARILADGAAIKGYDNILTELGSVQTPRHTDGIQIYSGQLIQLAVDNISLAVGGGFLVGGFIGHLFQRGGG